MKVNLRVVSMKNAMQDAKKETNETRREYVKRMYHAASKIVAILWAAFQKQNGEEQKRTAEALDAWHAQEQRVVEDPTYVPTTSSCGNLLAHSVAQYAADIMQGLSEYYLCRTKQGSDGNPCGFFAPSRSWATDDPSGLGGWYRCPLCGQQYVPWRHRPSAYVGANKLYVLTTDQDLVTETGKTLRAGSAAFLPAW